MDIDLYALVKLVITIVGIILICLALIGLPFVLNN